MEHPIGTMPRTPFPASRDFAPVGSMSLDFQVASLSYKSSSFATSRGNEKIGGTGYCVTYDTDSQSRNADFISIARRAIRHLQRRRRCRPLSASEHNPPPSGGHHPRGEAPSTFPSEPFEPSEPSHRRCVQGPMNPFSRKDTGIDIIICKMMSIISMCVHYNRQG